VRDTLVAVTVSDESPEDVLEEEEAMEVEVVMVADETTPDDAPEEDAAAAEDLELATLAVEAEDSMLDKIELAAVLVEACFERDEINAELLDGERLVAVKVVVATGVVVPGVVVDPALQEASAMPRAAASLQMAEEAQVMVKLVTLV
jgi:hypothetical protein